ncbi:hypothetical protein G7046_g7479 [Stylonectria norvegica]|nr:hypothetical protein G7046_g7479 [Stylonectria norvegica]
MPSKRKRVDSHPSTLPSRQQPKTSPSAKQSEGTISTLERPEGVRRSNRRTRHSTILREDVPDRLKASESSNQDGSEMPSISAAEKALDRQKPLWETREGVQQAMRELSKMEHKLQNDVRKQRQAVENSDLSVSSELSRNITHTPKLKSPKIDEQGRDHLGDEEKGPMKGNDEDLPIGEVAETTTEEDSVERGAKRAPPVNSDRLPLPWSGRLGYACLNTYLRNATPSVFSSRTCRIDSIISHRHPLKDPSQPEHPTKNRPDKEQPSDRERGQKYVQELGLANARDIVKMLRWNDKYGIKFMRLSSEMFPFASHEEHGYKLAPFASGLLAEAGKVAAELGHRLTTHPGQFTQIGSPRKEVVTAAVRDLEYHDELLSLLKLPDQMNRDAVMILHMGGTYGDKAATLDRFRTNYAKLSDSIKRRMVLENDDVAWSVHDLLPVCEQLNIPMVLDYHHHNIIFDPSLREGTQDIIGLYERIAKTWTRKRIRQKMHYSEPTAAATTPRDRRKHSARVKTLPPCAQDMDLMIEAKDKEQAVFELMRTFKLPGWDRFNDIVPHEREDESRKAVKIKAKKEKGKKSAPDTEIPEKIVAADDFGMGGPENRVYWPEGMEEWLRPKKREVTKKEKKEVEDKKVKKEIEENED